MPDDAKSPATKERSRTSPKRRQPRYEIKAEDVRPPKLSTAEYWERASHVSLVGLFLLAIVFTLYLTQPVVIPVLLAWVFGTILTPVVSWLEKRGVPRLLGVMVVALTVIGLIVVLFTLLSLPLTYWLGRASEVGALIKTKLQLLAQPLSFVKELSSAVSEAFRSGDGEGIKVQGSSPNIVSGILSVITPAISQAILFFGALVFYLVFQKSIRSESVLIFPSRESRLMALRIITDIEKNISVYFGTFTLVNIALGSVTTLMAYIVGLPNPLLWGVLAAIVNYVPYIGVVVMVAVLFVVGVVAFPSPGQAFIAPLAYIVLTTVEGQFITPAIMGRRMTLNPFAVFIAIGFWTWLWGPIGAFLAVPLLMMATVLARHIFPDDEPELPD